MSKQIGLTEDGWLETYELVNSSKQFQPQRKTVL